MAFDVITYALCKKQIAAALEGGGVQSGKSAFEVAQDNGFTGTVDEWLDSLVGEDGKSPSIGANGNWFIGDDDTGVAASVPQELDWRISSAIETGGAGYGLIKMSRDSAVCTRYQSSSSTNGKNFCKASEVDIRNKDYYLKVTFIDTKSNSCFSTGQEEWFLLNHEEKDTLIEKEIGGTSKTYLQKLSQYRAIDGTEHEFCGYVTLTEPSEEDDYIYPHLYFRKKGSVKGNYDTDVFGSMLKYKFDFYELVDGEISKIDSMYLPDNVVTTNNINDNIDSISNIKIDSLFDYEDSETDDDLGL